jgi:predicted nucleic-acid-binding Zn-ribbon protein
MSEVKRCPKCGGEMEKGRVRGYGTIDARFDTSESFWYSRGVKIRAFSCSKCGYIELYKEKKGQG